MFCLKSIFEVNSALPDSPSETSSPQGKDMIKSGDVKAVYLYTSQKVKSGYAELMRSPSQENYRRLMVNTCMFR